ncbi:hypothetical protein [Xenorhabdus thailandensis]|uniref:hypothetical protein n=1 Tax=Xenorhabdus thailandensis TaxID=3136255 RepID=UPI0030F396AA
MKNNKMEISIQPNADLVIGQYVRFVVTLSSDKLILPLKNIIIKNSSNNTQFDKETIPLVYEKDFLTASAQLGFIVLKEVDGNSIKEGSPIEFEVHTDAADFNFVLFSGTTNQIDINSLAFFIEKPYLKASIAGNEKPSEKDNFTAIYTTLKSTSGKVLAGTPVFITSVQKNKMKEFSFNSSNNQTELIPEKIGPNEGITIISDKNGLAKFYLYPKSSLMNTLLLETVILNVDNILAKKMIYVVNYKEPGYLNSIGMPSIEGNTPEGLTAYTSDPNFLVSISSYDGAENGDLILFFVNGHYTGYSMMIEDKEKQLDQYSIKLPYAIFKQDEASKFSYTVVKSNGKALYSEPIPVTYLGGIPYEANPNVDRSYEHCLVHTSIGVGPDNIIPTHNGVAYASIMQYPGYKHNGLFIEIVRSNTQDPNLTVNPVPLSVTDFTLNMYIDSPNRNIMLTYHTPITLDDIGSDGNKDSIFFHIPYMDLAGIEDGGLSFYYQFYLDEKLEYGVVWDGSIDTYAAPGGVKDH